MSRRDTNRRAPNRAGSGNYYGDNNNNNNNNTRSTAEYYGSNTRAAAEYYDNNLRTLAEYDNIDTSYNNAPLPTGYSGYSGYDAGIRPEYYGNTTDTSPAAAPAAYYDEPMNPNVYEYGDRLDGTEPGYYDEASREAAEHFGGNSRVGLPEYIDHLAYKVFLDECNWACCRCGHWHGNSMGRPYANARNVCCVCGHGRCHICRPQDVNTPGGMDTPQLTANERIRYGGSRNEETTEEQALRARERAETRWSGGNTSSTYRLRFWQR